MLATDGHAYLEKGGVIYPIFTEIPKKKPTEYRIAQAPTIADLSLDHDIPIQKKTEGNYSFYAYPKGFECGYLGFQKGIRVNA